MTTYNLEWLQLRISWATADNFKQHTNPDGSTGGWVLKSLTIPSSVYIASNAIVYGIWARIGNWARILCIIGSKHYINVREKGLLQIGCHAKTIQWWEENYKSVGDKEGYSEIQIKEYYQYIQLAKMWFELYPDVIRVMTDEEIAMINKN